MPSSVLLVYPELWQNALGAPKGRLANFMACVPPLGLLYLSSALKKSGHTVDLLNSEFENADAPVVLKRSQAIDADQIGFYSTCHTEPAIVDTIKQLSDRSDRPSIIVGGPGVLEPEPYFSAGADLLLAGEGEQSFPELLAGLESNQSIKNVPGIIWREDKDIHHGPAIKPIQDLDSIEFPDWELGTHHRYHQRYYFTNSEPYFTMVASRGCPHRCSYCTVPVFWPGKLRRRSIQNTIEELKILVNKYRARTVEFYDDTFIINEDWNFELCRAIDQAGLKFGWSAYLYPRKISSALINEMARTGCRAIKLGIQSASPKILQMVGRRDRSMEHAYDIIQNAKKAGMIVITDVIVDLPGEDDKSIDQTAKFIVHADPTILKITTYYAIPGSQLALDYPEIGLKETPQGLAWRARIYRSFLLRPQPWLRFLVHFIRHPTQLIRALAYGVVLFNLLAQIGTRLSGKDRQHLETSSDR